MRPRGILSALTPLFRYSQLLTSLVLVIYVSKLKVDQKRAAKHLPFALGGLAKIVVEHVHDLSNNSVDFSMGKI